MAVGTGVLLGVGVRVKVAVGGVTVPVAVLVVVGSDVLVVGRGVSDGPGVADGPVVAVGPPGVGVAQVQIIGFRGCHPFPKPIRPCWSGRPTMPGSGLAAPTRSQRTVISTRPLVTRKPSRAPTPGTQSGGVHPMTAQAGSVKTS